MCAGHVSWVLSAIFRPCVPFGYVNIASVLDGMVGLLTFPCFLHNRTVLIHHLGGISFSVSMDL